jgi:hypothetical protein
MDFKLKVVTNTPLQQLWSEEDYLDFKRDINISASQIVNYLKSDARFVLADAGSELQWIEPFNIYRLWKSEWKESIADPDSKIDLDTFPKGYAYIASRWNNDSNSVIILLEKVH